MKTYRAGIIPVSPELLIEMLGLGVFEVKRTQYDFERDNIEFMVANDALPEAEANCTVPILVPRFKQSKGGRITLEGIRLPDGSFIKAKDLKKKKEAL